MEVSATHNFEMLGQFVWRNDYCYRQKCSKAQSKEASRKKSKLTIRFARYFNRETEEKISNMIVAPGFRYLSQFATSLV